MSPGLAEEKNVVEITISEFKDYFRYYYNADIPVNLIGFYGIGKSSIIKQACEDIAKRNNKKLVVLNKLSYEDKIKLLNVPEEKLKKAFVLMILNASHITKDNLYYLTITKEGNVKITLNIDFEILKKFGRNSVIFIDELSHADEEVQKILFSFILDRRLLSEYIGSYVVCAMNLSDYSLLAREIDYGVYSRMANFILEFNVDDFLKYAIDHKFDKRLIAFLSANRANVDRIVISPEELESKSFIAFHCPRTYEFLDRLIKSYESLSGKKIDAQTLRTLASSVIGFAAASQLVVFLEKIAKYNIKDIVTHPESFKNLEEDIKYYVIMYVVDNINQLGVNTVKEFFNEIAKYNEEFIQYAIIYAKTSGKLIEIKQAIPHEVFKKLMKYL